MKDIIEFLKKEGVSDRILKDVVNFRNYYKVDPDLSDRIPEPQYNYYGTQVWEQALSTLAAGQNLLLVGPKATGKNVLAEGLALAFSRPQWDISLYINTDAASLIGTDTFKDGEVSLRKGPILQCAENGGFGVLDEVNMAKNESLAVLHATLDFRRVIDVPGYERIHLNEATRFIGTMNYGYAGTRELNEALASRFMIIQMPVIAEDNLKKLISANYPDLKDDFVTQFAELFSEIRKKCEGGEISSKALDLRGLMSSIGMIDKGLGVNDALKLGVVNKCFDEYERQLVNDIVTVRFPKTLDRESIFKN
ncbi:MAG: MoxR family ATPase [Lachnospiraceae bacterium]|uniref:MoxR family ATPase n=1 Tax=Candidatus Weimeria bifida TaxID=2599074 RepID=A0A6N7IZE7_9FIRM|nr:MoxR family ATPase [Candidatus Weimeria bifida]RRF95449.1 MAG: MoxR family ATPase [Lachnospiraceae bacterium]